MVGGSVAAALSAFASGIRDGLGDKVREAAHKDLSRQFISLLELSRARKIEVALGMMDTRRIAACLDLVGRSTLADQIRERFHSGEIEHAVDAMEAERKAADEAAAADPGVRS